MKVKTPNPNGVASTTSFSLGSPAHDDPRVSAALEEYMRRRQDGEKIVRDEWLDQHADIREMLSECLDGLELILAAGSSSREPWQDAGALAGLRPATVLGDFRVLRELGRGGMGIVYEAEQVSLGRRVALKVLPPSSSLDPRWRQRFQVEAQAAANLRHDHIVPVFAVGIERGVQYYAMPYIEGRTLADVIHELRTAAGLETKRSLDSANDAAESSQTPFVAILTAEKLRPDAPGRLHVPSTEEDPGPVHLSSGYFRWIARLGVQAAEAIGHAHGLGIIHRDVKPSNLMVDQRGELWLTDFGLARLHDESGLTLTGDVLGTLRYMSPEQAQARRSAVDHRTDIYSLGATLYELATLRPAFEGRDRQELLNKITFDEPTTPRRLNPSIPRDLETIILKSMAKEIPVRYASAQELAEDMNRFLDDRSVLARSPSMIDRVAKFTRRHRVSLATASVMLFAGLAVGSVLLWLEQRRTHQALNGIQAVLERERRNSKMYFDMSDDITLQAMGELAKITTSKEEATAPNSFYRKALAVYEKMAKAYEPEPDMREVAAQAFHKVGLVRMIFRYVHKVKEFENVDAKGPYEKALALLRAAAAADAHRVEPLKLLASYDFEYAMMLVTLGEFDAALPRFSEAVQVDRRVLAEHPERTDLIDEINQRRSQIAQMFFMSGRQDDGESLLRELLLTSPDRVDVRHVLAWQLALTAGSDDRRAAEAVALARTASEQDPNNPAIWNTVALASLRARDTKGADAAMDRVMKLHTPESGDFVVQALIEVTKGDRTKARALLEQAAALKANDPTLPQLIGECRALIEQNPKPPG